MYLLDNDETLQHFILISPNKTSDMRQENDLVPGLSSCDWRDQGAHT